MAETNFYTIQTEPNFDFPDLSEAISGFAKKKSKKEIEAEEYDNKAR